MTVSPAPDRVAEQVLAFRRLRAEEPVRHDTETGFWHVYRHEDAVRVLTDTASFSSDQGRFLPPSEGPTSFNNKGNFLIMDPPRHRQLRGLVSQAFNARVIEAMAGRIAEITTTLLDKLGDTTEFDLVRDLANPLPVIVIAELLGLPVEDRVLFREWGEILAEHVFDNAPSEDSIATARPTLAEMEIYLAEKVRSRRRKPADDLLGTLVRAESDGRELDDEEIIGFAMLLLLAGHVTTTALLGNAVLSFNDQPGLVAELRDSPTLLPGAVEEVLRVRPPFNSADRISTEPVELSGRTIPGDARVVVWLASANRDSSAFREPDIFDPRRSPNPHLALGRGIHFCLGAPLARLEAKIALGELLRRYSEITVDRAAPLDYFAPSGLQAVKRLDVRVVQAR